LPLLLFLCVSFVTVNCRPEFVKFSCISDFFYGWRGGRSQFFQSAFRKKNFGKCLRPDASDGGRRKYLRVGPNSPQPRNLFDSFLSPFAPLCAGRCSPRRGSDEAC
jgi:hypothetical protein